MEVPCRFEIRNPGGPVLQVSLAHVELGKPNFTRADTSRSLQNPNFFQSAALHVSQAPSSFTVQGLTLVNPRDCFFHLLTPCTKEGKGRESSFVTLNPHSAPGKPRAAAQVHREAVRDPIQWCPVLSLCLLLFLPAFLLPVFFFPSSPFHSPLLPIFSLSFFPPLSLYLSFSYMILLYTPSWTGPYY